MQLVDIMRYSVVFWFRVHALLSINALVNKSSADGGPEGAARGKHVNGSFQTLNPIGQALLLLLFLLLSTTNACDP